MAHLDITDRYQGRGKNDLAFGYCGIDGRGGQFFTWHATLEETLASIEDDSIDPPQDWPARAYQEVRGFVRREYAAERRKEWDSLIPVRAS